jgi:hypothetical protein
MKILNDKAYCNKSLKRTQLYQLIKEVKVGKNMHISGIPTWKKIKFAEDIVTAVAAAVDEDHLKTVLGLASVHDQR